jgi:hypothetical protein
MFPAFLLGMGSHGVRGSFSAWALLGFLLGMSSHGVPSQHELSLDLAVIVFRERKIEDSQFL